MNAVLLALALTLQGEPLPRVVPCSQVEEVQMANVAWSCDVTYGFYRVKETGEAVLADPRWIAGWLGKEMR